MLASQISGFCSQAAQTAARRGEATFESHLSQFYEHFGSTDFVMLLEGEKTVMKLTSTQRYAH